MNLSLKKVMSRLFVLITLVCCLLTLTSKSANAGTNDPCCQDCLQQWGECLNACEQTGDINQLRCNITCNNRFRFCQISCPVSCR